MVKTSQAREISLEELQEKFGLQLNNNYNFFSEWTEDLPKLTAAQKQALERVKSNYLNP